MDAEVQILLLRLFASAALLLFVGVIGYLLWQDFRRAGTVTEAWVSVLESRDDNIPVGDRFPVQALASMPLNGQVRVVAYQGQWWLEMLVDGTLNQETFERPVALCDGDVIAFEHVRLCISIKGTD